ncbi:hypothetical protein DFH09DRAFT_1092547 [Mycena vulgaris]|nr:hypothetical protein DFH09DRAFT_1092547 [Mycena vulgaris]
MSPRRYKQYLRRHRFSILVHGTEAEHPVHLRVCRETPLISIGIHLWRQGYLPSHFTSSVHPSTRKSFLLRKMQWSDTVGDHDLGTLSSITLSVSLLGGASGGNEPGPSRPDRGKAKNFFTALKDGAAEPEPTKRKRKRSGRTSQASATKDQDGNASGSSDDGGAYDAEAGAQDEGEEPEDSDGDMVVDGAELAETLSAKTDPKAGKTRSKDTGKGKGKAKPTRKPAAKKSKTQPPSSFYWACSTDLLQDDSEEETDAPKTVKKAPRRSKGKGKTSPIWRFFHAVDDVEDAESDKNYFKWNLGNHTTIPITKTSNGNIGPLPHVPGLGRILSVPYRASCGFFSQSSYVYGTDFVFTYLVTYRIRPPSLADAPGAATRNSDGPIHQLEEPDQEDLPGIGCNLEGCIMHISKLSPYDTSRHTGA